MRINPVLRNESKLTVRTPKFTIMLFVFIALLSTGVIFYYKYFNELVFTNGLDLQSSIWLYMWMAIGQAVLLMFIVPSLTSTAICSEREKQTLDILLSSKLTPLQIIIGKLSASSLKVIMLIVCTMPLYAICGLIGGIKLSNIFGLITFFIINTIFVGSIGVFISTCTKTSKAATALTYAIVLFIYVGIVVLVWGMMIFGLFSANTQGAYNGTAPQVSFIVYLTPITGFASMLINQVGMGAQLGSFTTELGISQYAHYISIAMQLVLSAGFIYLASIKLNPLKLGKKRKNASNDI